MMRRLLAIIAIVCLPAFASGQRLLGVSDLASLSGPPPDHKIQYDAGPQQFGNLRLPRTAGPHPVVLFVHGGCWQSQYTIEHAGSLEQALTDAGYAVWSLEYRRVGDTGGGWPGTFSDVAKGADYLRTLAPKYSLDLNRVVVSGHSAGAQFALWLAARGKIAPKNELYVANPLPVKAVLALAPAPDLETLHRVNACGNAIDKLMGGSPADQAERYDAGSPMRLAPIPVPQVLLVGKQDQTWAPIGRAYYERARTAGDRQVTLIEAPDAGHFEFVAPKSSSTWALVLQSLRSLSAR
jgi:acetyl esterase/lipase